MDEDLAALEASLEHTFQDRELINRSLTHKSRAFEGSLSARLADNEQLEFLGDAVLGFLVSEILVEQYPALPEGRLSKLKAYLVSAAHLHKVAQDLNLGRYLRLGKGEELSGGRAKRAVLANAVEALLAALYLDAGIEQARRFVARSVVGAFNPAEQADEEKVTDFKGALQERSQELKLPPPRYQLIQESGPDHHKTFTIEARVGTECVARAEGNSKKSAGQRAAQLALEQLVARL